MPHFNRLTPGQAERLAWLAEECAEVIQAISKIQRHGYALRNPLLPDSPDNKEALTIEMGQVVAAMKRLTDSGDINLALLHRARLDKQVTCRKWLHHQGAFIWLSSKF